MTDRPRLMPLSRAELPQDAPQPSDATVIALALAEGCKTILALLAKRWPEVQPKQTCPKCGHRHL